MNPQLESWQATGESVLCLIEPVLFAFMATVCGWNIKQDREGCKCVRVGDSYGRKALLLHSGKGGVRAKDKRSKKVEEMKIEVIDYQHAEQQDRDKETFLLVDVV